MITKKLVVKALKKAGEVPVEEVAVGVSYTAVKLANDNVGLAYTLRWPCPSPLTLKLPVKAKVKDVAPLALSPIPVEASIGVACLNAVLNPTCPGSVKGDILEHIELQKGDVVGLIGNFPPIVEKLRNKVGKVYVFERQPTPNTYPDWAAKLLLPKCSVVLITGATLINKTLDELLPYTSNAREVALVGPSTTLAPEVFKETNITLLASVHVKNPQKLLRSVKLGLGFKGLSPYLEKVVVKV